MSRMEVLEVENSKLKRGLIVAMDEANAIKEKAKTLSDDLKSRVAANSGKRRTTSSCQGETQDYCC